MAKMKTKGAQAKSKKKAEPKLEITDAELLAELDKYRKKPKSFQFNEAQKRFVRLARQHQYPISKRNLFPIFVEKFEVDLSRRIFEGLVTEMEIKK